MKHLPASPRNLLFALAAVVLLPLAMVAEPLQLHPDNPHYFLFTDKPTILIGSGEHYGAVLNLDFDYKRYLEELARCGLNQTRTFSGVYCEPQGAFKIARNTLAPAPGRYGAPWPRTNTPGYANGGGKFDLNRWDDAYFSRLKDFVAEAARRGVVVELTLFCPFYKDEMWVLSPMNAANNVNNVGGIGRDDVYTLDKNGGLLPIHDAFVKKVVTELNGFDNLYYEICNEPYFGGVTMAWQEHIIATLAATEADLPKRHLISLNIANGSKRVDNPPAAVSIFNFHYASPPVAVAQNAHLNRVIGDNETGFKGTGDTHYRMEGWEFILAGGALYSHLDYSFVAGQEDGSFQYPPTQPGGGNANFRRQMQVLHTFINSFAFTRMQPTPEIVRSTPAKARATVLAEKGRQYAIYLFGGTKGPFVLELPRGTYTAEWLNPLDGKVVGRDTVAHNGGDCTLRVPEYPQDIALSLKAAQ